MFVSACSDSEERRRKKVKQRLFLGSLQPRTARATRDPARTEGRAWEEATSSPASARTAGKGPRARRVGRRRRRERGLLGGRGGFSCQGKSLTVLLLFLLLSLTQTLMTATPIPGKKPRPLPLPHLLPLYWSLHTGNEFCDANNLLFFKKKKLLKSTQLSTPPASFHRVKNRLLFFRPCRALRRWKG